jgi:hypothetical protein
MPEKFANRFQGQVNRYDGGKNGVLRFILDDFDPASPHHGRFEGQLKGNHFTWGITVYGFKRALVIIQWDNYDRDKTKLSWNTGEHNGYDLCECVRDYMHKIGKPYQSLIEAITSGEMAELICLQSEVGPADGFFSHVQAVTVADTVVTLEDAEEAWYITRCWWTRQRWRRCGGRRWRTTSVLNLRCPPSGSNY